MEDNSYFFNFAGCLISFACKGTNKREKSQILFGLFRAVVPSVTAKGTNKRVQSERKTFFSFKIVERKYLR